MRPFINNLAFCRRLGVILGGSLLACAVGCQEQAEIRQYSVPRSPQATKKPWRLLGAIVPHEKQLWVFRLDGPEQRIKDLQNPFETFVKSIRFLEKAQEPTWTLPEGWQQEAAKKQFSFATIRIGAKDPLEMSVSPLPRDNDAESIFRNVIRWRDQLGLDPIPQAELGQNTRKIDVNGAPATLVDISGFQVPRRPMFAARPKGPPAPAAEAPAAQAPLTYDVPKGWQELAAGGIRVAAFKVKEGDKEAEVTIIPLARGAGSVLANVNRWRGEVDLQPTTEARLADEVRPITVDGIKAHYVDLAGPKLRTLAVMLTTEENTWFFKMRGPGDLVGSQKTPFEGFVRSVRFKAPPEN